MNYRRLVVGLSLLCILIGGLLVCFVSGGLLNSHFYGVTLDQPMHFVGFGLLILGAVGIIVVWSMKKP